MQKEKSKVVFNRNMGANLQKDIRSILQIKEMDYHAKYLGLPTILGRLKKAVFTGIKERV